jgi:hypothetical protein
MNGRSDLPTPANERARLAALTRCAEKVLYPGHGSEETFDRVMSLAARVLEVPIGSGFVRRSRTSAV